jgi:hypothetical protein
MSWKWELKPRYTTGFLLDRSEDIGSSTPLMGADPRSNRYSHVKPGSTHGPVLDPTLTRTFHSVGRCRRALIDLPSDDFDSLLGSYQEVAPLDIAVGARA